MQPRPAQNTPRPWSSPLSHSCPWCYVSQAVWELLPLRAYGARGRTRRPVLLYHRFAHPPSSTTTFPSSIPGALANASVPSPLPPASTENQAAGWLAGWQGRLDATSVLCPCTELHANLCDNCSQIGCGRDHIVIRL